MHHRKGDLLFPFLGNTTDGPTANRIRGKRIYKPRNLFRRVQFLYTMNKKFRIRIVLFAAASLCLCASARGQSRAEFRATHTTQAPKIDGDLSDDVWNDDPLPLADWLSYNPLYGEKMVQRTEVRIAYDDRNIYFSFRCLDNEPEKIRTTVSRRDSVFNDDWVGLSLDSNATGQAAYHLFVNPSGIQMDALNGTSGGERFEADFVWDSAGKTTETGYAVEIKLPLQSIRFKGGADVNMGILFWRRISRSGLSAAWPDIPPGQWVFNRHAQLKFKDLEQPQLLEILPSITYAVNQARVTPSAWNAVDTKMDAGFSAKYGITSSITLDATVNPDFSQVESDAFQVVVNQRFPIFYSEKRPFFMEGMGLFNLAGTSGDGNMRTAVHTRRIVNPIWGTKVTGTAGKWTFGVLNAADETPEDIGNRGSAIADRNKFFTIGRATYGLGQSDYIGAMITDTEHAGRHNRVFSGDLSLRFGRPHQFSGTFMSSHTGLAGAAPKRANAGQATYSYSTRRFLSITQVERYGRDFQMDTAFVNRTGFTGGWHFAEVNFYPRGGNFWIKRIHPVVFTKMGHDEVQAGNDRFTMTGVRMNFTRQGFLGIQYGSGREPWKGRIFKTGRPNAFGNAQIFRWLNLGGNFGSGWGIFYDPVAPFQGRSTNFGINVTLQPSPHFSQNISYSRVAFDRASTGERVYTVNIVNLRATYQFDKHFLIRAIEQFDSSRQRLLTDLLASYEFVPGSVIHAGYGSLYEKRDFQNGTLIPNAGHYLTTNRGLFFKASYLYRF